MEDLGFQKCFSVFFCEGVSEFQLIDFYNCSFTSFLLC